MKQQVSQLFQFASVLILASSISSGGLATTVGGFITADTHWPLSGSPYFATSSVLVDSGATLTIDAGVEVRFAKATGLLVSNGTLSARGTVDSAITFTADQTGDANRWNGIRMENGATDAAFDVEGSFLSGSILENVIVEAVALHEFGSIRLESSSPFIHSSIIRNNLSKAVSAKNANGLRVIGNEIHNNGNSVTGPGGGIGVVDSPNVVLSANYIADNRGFRAGINLNGSSDAIISDNEFHRNSGTSGGLYVSDGPRTTIIGNTISDNTSSGSGGGIFIQSSRVMVRDNLVERNTSSSDGGGLYLCCSSDSVISRNIFRDNKAGSRSSVYVALNNGVFSDNLISGGSGIGLELRDTTTATLNGNRIVENDDDGIRILRSRGLSFTANEVLDNKGDGFQINGTFVSDIVISDDPTYPTTIAGNGGYQIYSDLLFDGTTNPVATGNVDARNVWWGTTDIATIQAGIFDFFDNSNYGIVFHDPAASSPGIEGDFNRDGALDAADYTLWRDRFGTFYTEADFDAWKANFGYESSDGQIGSSVPEPSITPVALFCCLILAIRRKFRAP